MLDYCMLYVLRVRVRAKACSGVVAAFNSPFTPVWKHFPLQFMSLEEHANPVHFSLWMYFTRSQVQICSNLTWKFAWFTVAQPIGKQLRGFQQWMILTELQAASYCIWPFLPQHDGDLTWPNVGVTKTTFMRVCRCVLGLQMLTISLGLPPSWVLATFILELAISHHFAI